MSVIPTVRSDVCPLSTASPVGEARERPHRLAMALPSCFLRLRFIALDKNRSAKTIGLQGHKLCGTLKLRRSASGLV